MIFAPVSQRLSNTAHCDKIPLVVRRLNAAIEEAYHWLGEGNHAALLVVLSENLLVLIVLVSPSPPERPSPWSLQGTVVGDSEGNSG